MNRKAVWLASGYNTVDRSPKTYSMTCPHRPVMDTYPHTDNKDLESKWHFPHSSTVLTYPFRPPGPTEQMESSPQLCSTTYPHRPSGPAEQIKSSHSCTVRPIPTDHQNLQSKFRSSHSCTVRPIHTDHQNLQSRFSYLVCVFSLVNYEGLYQG